MSDASKRTSVTVIVLLLVAGPLALCGLGGLGYFVYLETAPSEPVPVGQRYDGEGESRSQRAKAKAQDARAPCRALPVGASWHSGTLAPSDVRTLEDPTFGSVRGVWHCYRVQLDAEQPYEAQLRTGAPAAQTSVLDLDPGGMDLQQIFDAEAQEAYSDGPSTTREGVHHQPFSTDRAGPHTLLVVWTGPDSQEHDYDLRVVAVDE